MSVLDNKKVLVIGDRDGIPGQAIEETLKGKELKLPDEIFFLDKTDIKEKKLE